ncbi:MAG: NrtA/SsuA/CpmA family ABC transporter substrate-binding protein [Nitrospirae bacterium]|nr:NrtA/SsuA/CpmA family ABC transporter substrate-binding protein [Nitrospirota bacterium]
MTISRHINNALSVMAALLTGVFCSVVFSYASSDTPAEHRYSTYEFGKGKNVINIGTQPLYVPTNIIIETMSRDAVLYDMLKESGMEVRFFPFFKGSDVNDFLLRGDLQVGVGGDMPAIEVASADKVLVASLMQYGFTSVVAERHTSIKDLRGTRIGYAFGSNAHYVLLNALSVGGNTPKDVHLVKMDVTDMVDALKARRIDAFCAWEPTVTEALATLTGFEVIYSKVTSAYLYFRKDFHDSHPDAVDAIVASELRALRWLQRDKRNLLIAVDWVLKRQASFSSKSSPLTPEQIATLALDDLVGVNTDPRLPAGDFTQHGRLRDEFDFLKAIGLIPPTVSLDTVYKNFDPGIIRRVTTNPRRYRLDEYHYR